MNQDLALSIDVGTGSARAGLVDMAGNVLAIASREHDQIVPAFGWAEQRPTDWWAGAVASVREVLGAVPGAAGRVAAVCACGQMHGTVLVDEAGEPTRDTAPLWNDKRTSALVAAYEAEHAPKGYLGRTGNPPTAAWPGFKLRWIKDNDPEAYRRAAFVLMPKDYVNLKLCGEVATDRTEASCTFLMDPRTGGWSAETCAELGVDPAKLPPILEPGDVLGAVTAAAAAETGLKEGTPVLAGCGDFPAALLGSGACRPGVGSEVLGTSCIVTLINERPLLDPEISNVATPEGNWGAFVLLDSGGDAVRWARRALHENALSYAEIGAKAGQAPAGSNGLFFVPYLTGERLGSHRNARAQFFGLGAAHGTAELHRAVLEGVAYAVKRHVVAMERAAGRKLERVVASGGGAKNALWLKIKASAYGIPILVPKELECGLIGCAALVGAATGRFASIKDAADALVAFDREVEPDRAWADVYARGQPLFEKIHRHAQGLYDDLDAFSG